MTFMPGFFCSSIGRKIIMAVTGGLLFLFVILHLLGNLQIFAGPEKINEYGEFLEDLGPLLWAARITLLAVFLTHISTAFKLNQLNKGARPVPYFHQKTIQATTASLYMLETGMLIFIFVLIHLMHFTFGILHPELTHLSDLAGRDDIYSMIVKSFQDGKYAIGYICAMLVLGLHLSHAFSSFFQTLGFNHPRYTPLIKKTSLTLAALIVLGYISIPLSSYFGLLKLPLGSV